MFRTLWKTRFGKFGFILLGCLVALLWNLPFVAFSFRTVVGTAASPFQNAMSFLGYYAKQAESFFVSVGNLRRENERLLSENITLKAKNAECSDRIRENEALRKEIGLLPRDRFELKEAEVIGRDDPSSGGAILLDKGSVAGVEKGMVVIAGGGVLIGRVAETAPFSSRVVLVFDSESAVNAVAGANEARGVVRGEYGLGLVFDMVLQSDTFVVGDEVITSGLGGGVPRGFLIGTVTKIESSADGLFQRATIASPVRFDGIRFVSIVFSMKS